MLEVDGVVPLLRELAEEAGGLGREAAPHLRDEHEHVVPALQRLCVLSSARRLSCGARRYHLGRRVVAQVLRQQPRARRAEGLRSTGSAIWARLGRAAAGGKPFGW